MQFHQWLRATGHRHNGDTTHTLHSRWRRLVNAEVEYEPYEPPALHTDGVHDCDPDCDPGNCEVAHAEHFGDDVQPDWAPYVRLATCSDHGLEPVTGHRTIPTGPGDLCDVGTFACGAVVAEDVF